MALLLISRRLMSDTIETMGISNANYDNNSPNSQNISEMIGLINQNTDATLDNVSTPEDASLKAFTPWQNTSRKSSSIMYDSSIKDSTKKV